MHAEKISRPRAAASGRPATRWASSRKPLIKLGSPGHAERREGGGFTGTCAPDETRSGGERREENKPGERGGRRGPNLAISANFRQIRVCVIRKTEVGHNTVIKTLETQYYSTVVDNSGTSCPHSFAPASRVRLAMANLIFNEALEEAATHREGLHR